MGGLALLLTLAAVTLLTMGLASGSALLLVGSIAASLSAAVGTVVRVHAAPTEGDHEKGAERDESDQGRSGGEVVV